MTLCFFFSPPHFVHQLVANSYTSNSQGLLPLCLLPALFLNFPFPSPSPLILLVLFHHSSSSPRNLTFFPSLPYELPFNLNIYLHLPNPIPIKSHQISPQNYL